MAFMYSASQSAQAVTTAVDLYHITAGADRPVELHWLELFQTTDVGDAAEEIIGIGIYSGVTGGGGGSALTEEGLDNDAPTATAAVVGQGAASTGGSLKWIIGWNIRQAGPVWVPTPECRIRIDAGADPVAFRLMAAPGDSITLSSTLAWREL